MLMDCVKKFFSYFVKPDVLAKCKTGSFFLKYDMKEGNLLH